VDVIQVNENSGVEGRARCRNGYGRSLVSPTTLEWKLVDEASGKEAQGWTATTVQVTSNQFAQMTDAYALIEVPAQLNRVGSRNRGYEVKVLTVSADRGTDREFNKSFRYRVNKVL
jgi:hypothetical protein